MKLETIRLNQFRQFREPFELTDLTDGINLIVGPNESGKSTVAEAIRAAFFERHTTRSVESLRPWDDSAAAPEVELVFAWQGDLWTLKKRFLRQARCDLQHGDQHASGAQAEDLLATLLGYSFPGRGSSKAEHHGIPGLLWVTQGDGQDLRPAVSHASQQLHAALATQVNELASSSGDAVIQAVEQQRAQWLTPSGRPTGEYRKVLDDEAAATRQGVELDNKIVQYRQQVDELGRLRQLRRDIDDARPWLVEQQRAQAAQDRLDAVHQLQQQQEHDRRLLASHTDRRDLYRTQDKALGDEMDTLARRAQERQQAQAALQACEQRRESLQRQQQAAQAAYDQANRQQQQVFDQARRQALQNEHDHLTQLMQQRAQDAAQAQEWHDTLTQWRLQLPGLALDASLLAELTRAHKRLDELAIQQAAVATRLHYAIDEQAGLTLAGQPLSGEGERLLVEVTQIDIPGVGHLRLTPGGRDIADLARDQQRQQTRCSQLLQQLGVTDLASAKERARQHDALAVKIHELTARLEILAPRGVDELTAQCQQDSQRRQRLIDQLAALPPETPDLPDATSAQEAFQTAQRQLKQAEEALHDWSREQARHQQVLQAAQKEWEQLSTRLADPEHTQRRQTVQAKLVDLNAEIDTIERRMASRQADIQAARPDILAQDIQRHAQSANSMQKEADHRAQGIMRLETGLQALGAQGLEEQREQWTQVLDRLGRRRQELERRTGALDLLLAHLRAERQTLVQQLQAPLQNHLQHYLTLLFPRAQLSVNEQLIPEALSRERPSGSEHSAVDALSFGAREQLGLLCRLAYADLLRAAGRPTLIILDDALVHSDETRLAAMKRILFDAATRHQILLFSCHPQRWRDVGVSARDLQALKAQT